MNYNETSQWAADLGSGYSSIRPLGEGGMGTLYRAHKDSLDVDVVIKRVKQKFKGRMDERAEANILKTLKHKYLPRMANTRVSRVRGITASREAAALSAPSITASS